jgi:hypothetical protein
VYIHPNLRALPRARMIGRPVYVGDERSAAQALRVLGTEAVRRVVVEDPDRPLSPDQFASGTATIVREIPERVEIRTEARMPAYLLLADTFDPGWSATVDGKPAPIRPANVAFRAVALPEGTHTVVFTYRPVWFREGLAATLAGLSVALVLIVRRISPPALEPEHGPSPWPRFWPLGVVLTVLIVVAASVVRPGQGLRGAELQTRWVQSFHPFTWDAKIRAIKPPPPPLK